ncbi:T4-like virus tail tube protein gp19 [Pelotomaculum schinkii]|uniref:T4-like virus tail tube protein gp19 n=1 Tax=Pelotomaculum schinkii TaxID=78350 RepID=A0A4Y7RGD7_9FIRM|nr:phage tail protein [Pelotomaculum schinkii]TEB07876.1 T4-like virus tail tube protein gp19 [Pelotomaculum schinkii]
MAALGFNEAYRTHEFVVEIEGIESPNITKVTGLTEGEVEAIEQPDGGANITHKISSGIIKYGDLTLERNMDGSNADKGFKEWFQTMFTIDGTGTGSQLRRNGSIVVKEHQKEVMRFVFEGAWIKSSKFSDLDAGSSGLMKQTIVLAIERMYRV